MYRPNVSAKRIGECISQKSKKWFGEKNQENDIREKLKKRDSPE